MNGSHDGQSAAEPTPPAKHENSSSGPLSTADSVLPSAIDDLLQIHRDADVARTEHSLSPDLRKNVDLQRRRLELENTKLEAEIAQIAISRRTSWITPTAIASILPIIGALLLFVYNEIAKQNLGNRAIAEADALKKEKELLLAEKRTLNSDVVRLATIQQQFERQIESLEQSKEALKRYQEAVSEISNAGGVISTSRQGNDLAHVVEFRLGEMRKEDVFDKRRATILQMDRDSNSNERAIRRLKDLGIVTRLHLEGGLASDKCLELLRDVKSLDYLALDLSSFSEQGLASLSQLPQLKTLTISSPVLMLTSTSLEITDFTNDEIDQLVRIPKLNRLALTGRLPSESLAAFAGLRDLRELHLSDSHFDSQDLLAIRTLLESSGIETLGLHRTGLRSADIRKLPANVSKRIVGVPTSVRYFIRDRLPTLESGDSADEIFETCWKKWKVDADIFRVQSINEANVEVTMREQRPVKMQSSLGPPDERSLLVISFSSDEKWDRRMFEFYATMGTGFVLGGRPGGQGILNPHNSFVYSPNLSPTPTELDQDNVRRGWEGETQLPTP